MAVFDGGQVVQDFSSRFLQEESEFGTAFSLLIIEDRTEDEAVNLGKNIHQDHLGD